MSQTLPAPMPDLLLVEGPVPTLAWPWCILPPIHLQRPAAVLEAPMPSATSGRSCAVTVWLWQHL
jgi:hypothetical protein